ncbi:MAG TPA: endonuclease domain-containing protein [Acidimicrobiia bacterium]|nr:endonuclease domain-containing protein [Acidimicrobiia bacterium]
MARRKSPLRTERARRLRRAMTEAETVVWNQLRGRQLHCRFRRQHVIGPYIVDFVCMRHRWILEIDGSQHLESVYDDVRTRWLEDQGFVVMRFWNNEVLGNLEMVLITVASHIPPDEL